MFRLGSVAAGGRIMPLDNEARLKTFKYSVLASKNTRPITVTKINWLMLSKEIIAAYTENHMKPTNNTCEQNVGLFIVKAGGTYSYH
jgi:hypothetical protein